MYFERLVLTLTKANEANDYHKQELDVPHVQQEVTLAYHKVHTKCLRGNPCSNHTFSQVDRDEKS